jgi:hypothetical protein
MQLLGKQQRYSLGVSAGLEVLVSTPTSNATVKPTRPLAYTMKSNEK